MTKVAFVVPWWGADLRDEPEQHVFRIATKLASRGHPVEVLTTCARSREEAWRDILPEGVSHESAVAVRRFPIGAGDASAWKGVNRALHELDGTTKRVGVSPVAASVERSFVDDNLHSWALLDHLRQRGAEYSSVVFADFRYGTTLLGVELCSGRAFLVPFLRDETAAWLPSIEKVFGACKRIVFGSEAELLLAAQLYGPAILRKGTVFPGQPSSPTLGDDLWERIADAYEQVLGLRSRPRPRHRRHNVRAIHQLLPSIDYGDAISNQAVFTMEVLRDLGYTSDIFVLDMAEPMQMVAKRFSSDAIEPDDGILYHHAIGTSLTGHVVRHPGPKALVYHNITPARFFEPWDRKFARILDMGRRDLHQMVPHFPISAGDSLYNADELRQTGYRDPAVVPIFVEPMRWNRPADAEWMKMLQDGRTNILFVGRVTPNKCQQDLLYAFREYLVLDPQARLILVGVWPEGHPYARFLREEADRLGITSRVVMTSRVTEAQLFACYRTAHLFWSMSEHEGFCVPLIEAMWFDVPALAYASSAVPETLGESGMLFTEKGHWEELATLAHMLVEDGELRQRVVEAQRRRRTAFLPESILPALLGLLARLTSVNSQEPEVLHPRTAATASEYPSMMRGQR